MENQPMRKFYFGTLEQVLHAIYEKADASKSFSLEMLKRPAIGYTMKIDGVKYGEYAAMDGGFMDEKRADMLRIFKQLWFHGDLTIRLLKEKVK